MNLHMSACAVLGEQMQKDSQRIAALMAEAPFMQSLNESAAALARAVKPLNEQLARLNATGHALSQLVEAQSADTQQRITALRKRQRELAEHHAGLSARLAYVLRAAEKQGRPTHLAVVQALSGDSEAQHDLRVSALRGNALAACVLALIAEITAHAEQVLDFIAEVSEALTHSALERLDFTALAPPLLVRAGTASPNGPPTARPALSVSPSTCLDIPASPSQGEPLETN
jgi:septal ring factor EnvC (AmiA/AmiB activator)